MLDRALLDLRVIDLAGADVEFRVALTPLAGAENVDLGQELILREVG